MDQFFLSDLDPKMIKVSNYAIEEARKIAKEALNNTAYWTQNQSYIRIVSLNARSFVQHYQDIANHFVLASCNVLCINETFLPLTVPVEVEMENFDLYTSGKGRGRRVFISPLQSYCLIGQHFKQLL